MQPGAREKSRPRSGPIYPGEKSVETEGEFELAVAEGLRIDSARPLPLGRPDYVPAALRHPHGQGFVVESGEGG